MGCNAQVHEKADAWGTWAYHLIGGWYLYTSPKHYHTHVCHIKSTRHERLSNTVEFKHKQITNPTITHADKIMIAIAAVVKAIKGLGRAAVSDKARELQQLVNEATTYLTKKNSTNVATI